VKRRLVQVAEVTLGRQRAPKYEQGANLVPYLRSANVVNGGLDLRDVKCMNFSPSDQAIYSLKAGDVLVTEGSGSRETVGTSAVWRGEVPGTVCFQNTLLRLRPRAGLSDGRYLGWWMRHAHAAGAVARETRGANIQHLGAESLRGMESDFPDVTAQRLIADFLDDQVSRVDEVVRLRRQQVEAMKLAVASRLDSVFGVENFESTRPLKSLVSLVTSGPRGWGDLADVSGDSPFLRVTNVSGLGIEVDERNLAWVSPHSATEATRSRTRVGDLLITITADLGSVAVVREPHAHSYVSQHVGLVRPIPTLVDPDWLAWAVHSPRVRANLTMSGAGGTKAGLSLSDVRDLRVPDTTIEEQRQIAGALNESNSTVSALVSEMNAQVALLEERKRSLITAAVTGQFDVTTASGRGI
jgi:type I restriction enzyme S subunit